MLAKAIFVDGKVVTGRHHGEAFSLLSEIEKNSQTLLSGFWDQNTGRFIADQEEFYTKRIYLIRHSLPSCPYEQDLDPDLCIEGCNRALSTGMFLKHQNLEGYKGFTSPYKRCLQTANIISLCTGIPFIVDPCLVEPMREYTYIKNHSNDFSDFEWATTKPFRFYEEDMSSYTKRIHNCGVALPEKSVLISHCSFIANMAELLSGHNGLDREKENITPASLTYIDNNRVVYYGKQCQRENEDAKPSGS